jgi:hypothetical protein
VKQQTVELIDSAFFQLSPRVGVFSHGANGFVHYYNEPQRPPSKAELFQVDHSPENEGIE